MTNHSPDSPPGTPPASDAPAISSDHYRHVLGHFLTGVTVITAVDGEGRLCGFTANAFNALSIDPPLVLVCPSYASETYPVLRSSGRFAVHLLAEGQDGLARLFAGKSREKGAACNWYMSEGGWPVLDGVMGVIECRFEREYEGGDHAIVIGAVETMRVTSQAGPLAYYRGRMQTLRDLQQAAG